MRMACRLDPRTGFQMAGEWLKYQLTAPVDTGPMNCELPGKKIGMWDLFFSSSQEETSLPFFFSFFSRGSQDSTLGFQAFKVFTS